MRTQSPDMIPVTLRRTVEMYGIRQVANATGIPMTRITNWLDRDFAVTTPFFENPGRGFGRLFTRERVYTIALAGCLINKGMPVRQASYLALHFSEVATDGEAYILGDEPPAVREPGELYPDDTTLFRVCFHADGTATASVDRASAFAGAAAFTDGARAASEVWLINLNRLVQRVDRALGLPVAVGDRRCEGPDIIIRTND